ncbi:MAG: hypothetical protein RLZZ435_2387 [Cyanobacteriota bacterium]|jgi:hypothetical protein
MSDANKTSGVPKPETEADWVIDLDKLAAETGTPPHLSITPVPVTEHSQQASTLEGMTGTEFFRLASDAATASDLSQAEIAASPQYYDLQQQNEQLMDWVGELEESLNQCQTALQFQRQRSQELEALLTQRQKADSSSSLEAHFNRALQESQQQVQKQQILVDTLTQQLDNTKERVSYLEQEYGGLQKRFADQTQRLVQSENECRSLKTRLSRQQRYTLQFKAALERCLEVSVPLPADTEAPPEETTQVSPTAPALPEPVTFFPRSSPVQPWSATEASDESLPEANWQKVTQWMEPSALDPQEGEITEVSAPSLTSPEISDPLSDAAPRLEAIDTSSLAAEAVASVDPVLEPVASSEVSGISPPEGSNSLSSTPLDSPEITTSLLGEPPVAEELDYSGEADQSSRAQTVTGQNPSPEPQPSWAETSPKISLPTLVDPLNLDAALQAVINLPQSAAPGSTNPATAVPPEQPYELWQSLAKNAEGGAEASAPEESRARGVAEESPSSAPSLDLKVISFPAQKASWNLQHPNAEPAASIVSPISEEIVPEEPERVRKQISNPLLGNSPSLNLQPSWPSPLVYPLRPPKKRGSLAAIELPRFPQK